MIHYCKNYLVIYLVILAALRVDMYHNGFESAVIMGLSILFAEVFSNKLNKKDGK